MSEQEIEFYMSLAIPGGIILIGICLSIALMFLGLAIKKKIKKGTIIKELYDEKERKNGQHKGGSHGSF